MQATFICHSNKRYAFHSKIIICSIMRTQPTGTSSNLRNRECSGALELLYSFTPANIIIIQKHFLTSADLHHGSLNLTNPKATALCCSNSPCLKKRYKLYLRDNQIKALYIQLFRIEIMNSSFCNLENNYLTYSMGLFSIHKNYKICTANAR